MSQHVLLNNVQHKDTRIRSHYGEAYGENISSVLAFPTEFVELQKEYPIFFRKTENDEFQAVALLGLHQDENLFLDASTSSWTARYIPAIIEKGPFLIGFQQQDQQADPVPVIHIDMDHPKVNEQDGHPVFLEHGGNSPYLEHVATRLQSIHQGMEMQKTMYQALDELGLFEPVNIEFELINNEKCRLVGNYTIQEERLRDLEPEKLAALNRSGFLQPVYAAIASITNVQRLIGLKNERLA